MSEQDLVNRMGTLNIQIIRDEKELERRKKEGADLANKLRLAADCLEGIIKALEVGEEQITLRRNVAQQRGIEVTTYSTKGDFFQVPVAEKVMEVMKRIYELEKQLEENKEEKKKLENSL